MTPPTEMELRVAEAILATLDGQTTGPRFPMLSEKNRSKVLAQSRAAIRAMREPTQDMVQACMSLPYETPQRARWETMIDAASPDERT